MMKKRIIRRYILQGKEVECITELMQRIPELTSSELRIAALIMGGKTTAEAAAALGTSERTIENHRYRIRKKIRIPKDADLQSALEGKHNKIS